MPAPEQMRGPSRRGRERHSWLESCGREPGCDERRLDHCGRRNGVGVAVGQIRRLAASSRTADSGEGVFEDRLNPLEHSAKPCALAFSVLHRVKDA
jgi:hypothetical protein